jgi:ABC-type uncharacterized transport system ATPase subunit
VSVKHPALELRAIEKRFGSTVALSGASLSVRGGTLHMLLGENGAGKTTLLRVASGFLSPEAGGVTLVGRAAAWHSRADGLRAGIAVVEQHFSLVPAMTVAENVALGSAPLTSRYSPRQAAERVRRIAESVGLQTDPEARVSDLPVAAQQRAEIVKALATDASILILDEPTAVLSPAESDDLFAWLRKFVSSGKTAIVITHRLREAMRHGDALTVLRGGKTVLVAERGTVTEHDLVTAILGGGADAVVRPVQAPPVARLDERPAVAELDAVTVRDVSGVVRLRSVSLSVQAGEIIGVAGVEGSGQRELLRLLAGRLVPSEGIVRIPDAPAFIPEDRLRDAMIAGMSVIENWALRGLGERRGWMRWNSVASTATRAVERHAIRVGGVRAGAGSMSGGNQQRLVVARELDGAPPLIVAENPTRGLDIRAAAEVLERLRAARDGGAGIVLHSTDLEDLVGIADRMLVCFSGTVREVPCDLDAIGTAMLGTA